MSSMSYMCYSSHSTLELAQLFQLPELGFGIQSFDFIVEIKDYNKCAGMDKMQHDIRWPLMIFLLKYSMQMGYYIWILIFLVFVAIVKLTKFMLKFVANTYIQNHHWAWLGLAIPENLSSIGLG